MNPVLNIIAISILSLFLLCCGHHDKKAEVKMDKAESLMETSPDSALLLLISVAIHKGLRNFEGALSHHEIFSHMYDSINYLKRDYEIRSIEEKHSLENKAREESIHKSRIIGLCGVCIIILLISLLIVSLMTRP